MAYTFILSTDSRNRNGYKVLTSGIDILNYEKNPVLLVQHEHYADDCPPIGRVVNLRKQTVNGGAALIGDLEFATTDEAKKFKQLVDDGAMSAVSICFRIMETSDKPEDMDPGQYYSTVVSCELLEVSLVSIPGNADAVRMLDGSNQLAAVAMISADNKPVEGVKLAAGAVCTLSMGLTPYAEQAAETGGDGEDKAAADIDKNEPTLAFAVAQIAALAKQIELLSAQVSALAVAPADSSPHNVPPAAGGAGETLALAADGVASDTKRPSIHEEMQRQLAAAAKGQGVETNSLNKEAQYAGKDFYWLQVNAPEYLATMKMNRADDYEALVNAYLATRQ